MKARQLLRLSVSGMAVARSARPILRTAITRGLSLPRRHNRPRMDGRNPGR